MGGLNNGWPDWAAKVWSGWWVRVGEYAEGTKNAPAWSRARAARAFAAESALRRSRRAHRTAYPAKAVVQRYRRSCINSTTRYRCAGPPSLQPRGSRPSTGTPGGPRFWPPTQTAHPTELPAGSRDRGQTFATCKQFLPGSAPFPLVSHHNPSPTMSDDEELPPSKLGTKVRPRLRYVPCTDFQEHWDMVYE